MKTFCNTIYFILAGLSLGWMVGLSQSPVINTVLTALLGLVATLSLLRENLWENNAKNVTPNGEVEAHSNQEANDQLIEKRQNVKKDFTPLYLASFFFAIAVAGSFGLRIKNNKDWFEPDYEELVKIYSEKLKLPYNDIYFDNELKELEFRFKEDTVGLKTNKKLKKLKKKYRKDINNIYLDKKRNSSQVDLQNKYLEYNLEKIFFQLKHGVIIEENTEYQEISKLDISNKDVLKLKTSHIISDKITSGRDLFISESKTDPIRELIEMENEETFWENLSESKNEKVMFVVKIFKDDVHNKKNIMSIREALKSIY